jgi:hypothetical protein
MALTTIWFDDFERADTADGAGWSDGPQGAYTHSGSSGGGLTGARILNGRGRLTAPSNGYARVHALALPTQAAQMEILMQFRQMSHAGGPPGSMWLGPHFRTDATGAGGYFGRKVFRASSATNGFHSYQLGSGAPTAASTGTIVDDEDTPFGIAMDDPWQYQMRIFDIDGSSFRVLQRAWRVADGMAKEYGYDEITVATPPAAGYLGLYVASVTGAGCIWDIDWVRVRAELPLEVDVFPNASAVNSGSVVVAYSCSASQTDTGLVVATDHTFDTIVQTVPNAATAGDGHAWRATLTGLTPATRYHYAPTKNGTIALHRAGQFTTLPLEGSAADFKKVIGSCNDDKGGNNSLVWTRITRRACDMAHHGGDLGYDDTNTNDLAPFIANYKAQFGMARHGQFMSQQLWDYIFDDHDRSSNDGNMNSPSAPAAEAAYWAHVAAPPSADPATRAIYRAKIIGDVLAIATDTRTYRTPQNTTDGPAHTMLGAVQKQWWKDKITWAKANGYYVLWHLGSPWMVDPVPSGTAAIRDTYGGYPTERDELADHIVAEGMSGSLLLATYDNHTIGYYPSSMNAWGDFPVVCAAPYTQTADAVSVRGIQPLGGWDPDITGGPLTRQWGELTFTHLSANSLGVRFQALRHVTSADPLLLRIDTEANIVQGGAAAVPPIRLTRPGTSGGPSAPTGLALRRRRMVITAAAAFLGGR